MSLTPSDMLIIRKVSQLMSDGVPEEAALESVRRSLALNIETVERAWNARDQR